MVWRTVCLDHCKLMARSYFSGGYSPDCLERLANFIFQWIGCCSASGDQVEVINTRQFCEQTIIGKWLDLTLKHLPLIIHRNIKTVIGYHTYPTQWAEWDVHIIHWFMWWPIHLVQTRLLHTWKPTSLSFQASFYTYLCKQAQHINSHANIAPQFHTQLSVKSRLTSPVPYVNLAVCNSASTLVSILGKQQAQQVTLIPVMVSKTRTFSQRSCADIYKAQPIGCVRLCTMSCYFHMWANKPITCKLWFPLTSYNSHYLQ